MRKLILLFIFLGLFLSVAEAKASPLGPDLEIESVTINPLPVEPGETFDLTLKVRNANLKRTIFQPTFAIQQSFPFSVDSKTKVQVIPFLIPNEEILINFKIKVDENAVGDVTDLRIVYQQGTNPSYLSDPIKINIKSSAIELSVASIETIPEEIYPGDEVQLKLVIKNTLPVIMKNIDLNFDLSSSSTPFTPLGTTTQRTLTTLNKGNSLDLFFDIAVEADAEPKIYKVPLKINYEDEFGNPFTINTITGIKVSTSPKIQLDIERTEVAQAYTQGEVIVRISNNGLADLKLLSAKLQPSQDYQIISSPQVYIGNLESDDYETASFKILAKSHEKALPLKLLLTYRDAFNKEYETEETVYLPNYSGLKLSSFGLNSVIKYLFYLVIISFLYVTFKNLRKSKSLPSALKIGLITVLIGIKRVVKAIRPRTLARAIKATIKFLKEP